jgi:hypothetical protein
MFEDINKKHIAKRAFKKLRQKGAATLYIAEFQAHSFKIGWNNDFLKAQFYKGLKDTVKNNMLYIKKRLDTL